MMKQIIIGLYAMALSLVVLYLLWILQPMIIAHPKISAVVLFLIVPTSLAMMVRTLLGVTVLLPLGALIHKWNISPVAAYYIFILALLVGLVIPWINGIGGWGFWEWAASILYTVFIFETFFGFANGTIHVNDD